MTKLRNAFFFIFACLLLPPLVHGQASYTSQLSGVVRDSSGGAIAGAKVTLTDVNTNVATATTTDTNGAYTLTGLRPANYTLRVEAADFAPDERTNVVLAASQAASIDFALKPGSLSSSVTVTTELPLLDTANASLGTDVTNEYVRDIPLVNRSFFSLVFLAGGVTETAGQGTTDSYPTGTNFVSNGQRNATAEIRVDGALTSAPEQGEGATTNVYYQPSVEIVQEFKVENNSFSAEYGSNGGTVVNIVLKEGGNKFHGSGWWFGQRSALDANEFFRNAQGIPNPDHSRDQYGFSFSGPLRKNKTFFLVDFEKTKQSDPVDINAFVPTTAERTGDFRNSVLADDSGNPVQQRIFNPFAVDGAGNRPDFTVPNVIDANLIDPIGQKIINLYPMPTIDNPAPGDFNYHSAFVPKSDARQFDIKIDHHFSDTNRISGRYSNHHDSFVAPTVFGDGDFGDGFSATTDVQNASIEHNWSPIPTIVWTSRLTADRAVAPVTENYPDVASVFDAPGDAILSQANGQSRFPTIQMDNNASSLFNQCCTDTGFAHTLVSYNSAVSWVHGRHIFKFGGEQRLFYNNFSQPQSPTGLFNFASATTASEVNPDEPNPFEGNSFASLLLGYGDPNSSSLTVAHSVANKSKETAFYFQDDWRLFHKLTLNLGLRYEWSTPYNERHDQIQFSDFSGSSGIAVPINVPGLVNTTGDLPGSTVFAGPGGRNVPVDRNNWAPRLGFAYQMTPTTVVRGGAGIYYGLNVATNFQFTGTAFGATNPILFSKDNFQSQFATLENPFPAGFAQPQGQTYGAAALWGYGNNNSLDTGEARNAEIYQWNLGVQHLFPGQIVIGVDYSGSRGTHLPYSSFSGASNRNYLPSSIRNQIVNGDLPVCNGLGPSDCLAQQVANPFQPLFVPGSDQIFNEPSSIYNDDTIPLVNLLRPYPQFNGSFSGLTLLEANSIYHSLQVRFQKRQSHYISFEGNYTYSKSIDDSSAGANAFITNSLSSGVPQELDNLRAERSISANDATHRMVLATIIDLPLGRGRWIGHDMHPVLDAIVGGWSASTILTFQTGTPISIISGGNLQDGVQRPNITCAQVSSGISYHEAAATGANIFDTSCFAQPGDQVAGNAPRYFSNLRSDGIHNTDLSFSKEFKIHEAMKLQIRAEFFNFTNTPRFAIPDTILTDGEFGQVTSTLGSPRHMQFGVRFEF
ncbi:MAG TPA: TonB-dependent receptor [Candidatus Saccharimonadales bacterium]|nr:TonB-dependent receptor [Candidatus Saccharimonadales bacterium]